MIHSAVRKKGGIDRISFKPISVQYLRMYGLKRGTGWGYSLYEFEVFLSASRPVPLSEFKKTTEFRYNRADLMPETYYKITADSLPQGFYPIWLGNQQGYWTIVGSSHGYKESLICEDGTIELYPRSWSLMPYLYINSRLITRQDVEVTQSLEEGYLPIPLVRWRYEGLTFDQKLFSSEDKEKSLTCIWYKLTNTGSNKVRGKLFITFRPFQVTPPWQGDGGMMDLFSIDFRSIEDKRVVINGKESLWFITSPAGFGASSYLECDVMNFIEKGELPPHRIVYDPWGGATGALEYDFDLAPGEKVDYLFAAPIEGETDKYDMTREGFFENLDKTRSFWREKLNQVKIDIPDKYLVNLLKANIAYMLINKDGPVIQPGSRHYEHCQL